MSRTTVQNLALLSAVISTTANLITSPATRPQISPTAYPGIGIGPDSPQSRLPGQLLFKRSSVPCDGNSFWCPYGTCFTDATGPFSGLIGCCSSGSSCVPRTTCIAFTQGVTSPCDSNTGGCTYCSDPRSAVCMTVSNEVNGQWVHYCDSYASTETISYVDTMAPGSQWFGLETSTTESASQQTSFSAVPGMQQEPTGAASTESVSTVSPSSTSTIRTLTFSSVDSPMTTAPAGTPLVATGNVAEPTDNNSGASGKNAPTGAIAGAAVGGAAGFAILAAALWYTRARWLVCFGKPKIYAGGQFHDKNSTDSNTRPSTAKGSEANSKEGTDRSTDYYNPDQITRPAELEDRRSTLLALHPPHERMSTQGLMITGLGSGDRRYALTNPDPVTASQDSFKYPPPRPNASEAPNSERPLPASPAVSSVPPVPETPQTNSNSSPNSRSPVSPLTQRNSGVPYTPSAYAAEPPSSMPKPVDVAPPSLPQEYSVVSLGSTADIYRGLSRHGGRAPWSYLSPEEAVRGGWRNAEDEEDFS